MMMANGFVSLGPNPLHRRCRPTLRQFDNDCDGRVDEDVFLTARPWVVHVMRPAHAVLASSNAMGLKVRVVPPASD